MAEILPEALGWLDAKKQAIVSSIANLLSDPQGTSQAWLSRLAEGAQSFGAPHEEALSVMPEVRELAARRAVEQGLNLFGSTGLTNATKVLYNQLTPMNKLATMTQLYKELVYQSGLSEKEAAEYVGVKFGEPTWRPPPAVYQTPGGKALIESGPPKSSIGSADPFRPYGSEDAIQALDIVHGIDPVNVRNIQDYTKESADEILARFDRAREAFTQIYGHEGSMSDVRAARLGFGDIGNSANWLWRGSMTARPELQPPTVTGARATGTPEAIFGSFPANVIPAKGWGNIKTPLVSRFKQEDLFDVRNPFHLESISRDIPLPADRHWEDLEKPEVITAIKNAGFPGFLTNEGGGLNFGTFTPEMLRHPLAAFDPTQANSRNIFSSFAPVGTILGLAAALAAQKDPSFELQ